VNTVASLGLAVALPILLGGAVSIPLFVTTSQSAPLAAQSAPLAAEPAPVTTRVDVPLATQGIGTDARDRRAPGAEPGGKIDLYGNEVTDAVAKYTVDAAGSLYELHSPQTELPRLGIPKS
jgi:hypothetical protein